MSKPLPPSPSVTSSPFAGLSQLREQLPPGEVAVPQVPVAENKPKGPMLGKVVVRKERKGRGGKSVTLVQGVPAALRAELCDDMKKALGCGARVERDDIVLQGELVDRAAAWLAHKGATQIIRGS